MLLIFCYKPIFAKDTKLENNCKPISNTETATVKWVYDGDTLLVTAQNSNKKRKIRIIGIDTPETKHHKQKAQIYGAKAREQLRVLLQRNNYRVKLEYDKEKYDKYKRELAHVYLNDDSNISEWLLQQGFAKTLIIPPNTKHTTCYKKAEGHAQQQRLRLWSLKSNRIKTPQDLNNNSRGYIRLKGNISNIYQSKKALVLEVEDTNKNTIKLRIKNKYLRYFKGIKIKQLVGKQVIVSGLLKNKRGKKMITLSHASQLELLSKNKSKKLMNKESQHTIKWSLEK